jgi:hypothetical protein
VGECARGSSELAMAEKFDVGWAERTAAYDDVFEELLRSARTDLLTLYLRWVARSRVVSGCSSPSCQRLGSWFSARCAEEKREGRARTK